MVEMRLQFLPFYFYIIILKLLYYNLYKYLYAFLKFYFITNTFCYQYQVSDHILQPCLLFPFICFSPHSSEKKIPPVTFNTCCWHHPAFYYSIAHQRQNIAWCTSHTLLFQTFLTQLSLSPLATTVA